MIVCSSDFPCLLGDLQSDNDKAIFCLKTACRQGAF